MASPIEAGVVPSSLAEQYLQEGSQYIQNGLTRQAKRAFTHAVQEDPGLARNVADYYDLAGDYLEGPDNLKRKREYYGTAKDFYKRLLSSPAPANLDPLLFRADLDVRIGNAYNKMSCLHGAAYNAHDTDRALAYFNAAVEELGDLHMEQAHQGRLLALAKKLGHSQVRPWYQGGSHFEPAVLTAALQDLSTLYTLPASAQDLVDRFATTETLFTYPMDAASEALVKEEIIPQMASYLWQPAPNDAHAVVQLSVLSAFEKLLREHAWAAGEVAGHLQTFVSNGSIRYDQLDGLTKCYKALLDGNKAYAGHLVGDLELLREQFAGQERPLGKLVLLAHLFIDLSDAIDDDNKAPRAAIQTVLNIGVNTPSKEVLTMVIDALVYAADTYSDLSEECVRALGALAAAHDRASSPHRQLAHKLVKFHLLYMRRVERLRNVVLETLLQQLDVQTEEIVDPPASAALGINPPAAIPFAAARKLTGQN